MITGSLCLGLCLSCVEGAFTFSRAAVIDLTKLSDKYLVVSIPDGGSGVPINSQCLDTIVFFEVPRVSAKGTDASEELNVEYEPPEAHAAPQPCKHWSTRRQLSRAGSLYSHIIPFQDN